MLFRSITVTHVREIRIADSTFSADDKSFIGGAADAAPASFETLIHEVGHALEAKPRDDAKAAEAKAVAFANRKRNDAQAAQHAANVAINAALKGRFLKTDRTTAQPFVGKVLDAQKAIQAYAGAPDSRLQAAAKAAIVDRDKAKATVPSGNKVVPAFAAAITAQDACLAKVDDLLAAHTAAATAAANTATFMSGANTKRLQLFVDFVNKEAILPPTAYAKKHWPGEPAEFFDEAFSLWKNDPTFLGKHSARLKKWFDDGNHLK